MIILQTGGVTIEKEMYFAMMEEQEDNKMKEIKTVSAFERSIKII